MPLTGGGGVGINWFKIKAAIYGLKEPTDVYTTIKENPGRVLTVTIQANPYL